MTILVEKRVKNEAQTLKILEKFKGENVIYINDYKSIFYEDFRGLKSEKFIVVAKIKNSISKIPKNYGFTDDGFFFKTSLNCVFDCSYCYLKGANKNDSLVVFVNYDDVKREIEKALNLEFLQPSPLNSFSQREKETAGENSLGKRKQIKKKSFATPLKNASNYCSSPLPLGEGLGVRAEGAGGGGPIRFYSSDYSDILALNELTNFVEEFVPFFEGFENTRMEIRTKSTNIRSLLNLGFVPRNTEIAFSLNPQILIEKYEKKTPSLDERIEVINILLEKGFKVGLRFLPLLPVKDYEKIYGEFIEYLKENIDFSKIYSTFAGGLLYTKDDYNKIFWKNPELDILHMLKMGEDKFYREGEIIRKKLYKMFKDLDENCILTFEERPLS